MDKIINFPDHSQRQNPQASLRVHGTWGMTCYEGGCGEMSIANIAMADPCEVWKWMCAKGHVLDDQGTTYDGMIDGTKHFIGSGSLLTPSYISGQTSGKYYDLLEEHLKNGYCAILLMGGIPKGCRTSGWANYGHYVTACGYDNGKVLIHDSVDGFRTGWHGLRDASSLYGIAGNIKMIFLCDKKWKETDSAPSTGTEAQTGVTVTFRQIKPGDKKYAEIFIVEELLSARGYYDSDKFGLDFVYNVGANLYKAVCKFQKDNGLTVDGIVGPNTWRALLKMKGSVNGDKLTVILRVKAEDDTGTTVLFCQSVMKARGMYDADLDESNGPICQKGLKKYKEVVMKYENPTGTVTIDLLKNMCGMS